MEARGFEPNGLMLLLLYELDRAARAGIRLIPPTSTPPSPTPPSTAQITWP
jgi:hypothetical protein